MSALQGDSVSVSLGNKINGDISWISEKYELDTSAVRRNVIATCLEIADNPWIGKKMDPLGRDPELARFRRVYLDFDPAFRGPPRHRLVYLLEPEDGAPSRAMVWIIGPRNAMAVYDELLRRLS